MKAVIIESYGGPEQLSIGEWQTPEPKDQEVLVKVHATAVNRADIQQRMGKYPPPEGASPILGLEMSGTVVSRGGRVTRWKEGDELCGLLPGGGYAEYAVIHEDLAMAIPGGLDLTEAAAVPEVFMTAFQAVNWIAGLRPDEWILIHAGASGVGTAAIQLAREMGAGGIIVTASGPKHELCTSLGADYAVDYKTEDIAEKVKEYTRGRGVDAVIDFIAAPYFGINLEVLRTDGRMVMLAFLGGVKTDRINLVPILAKRLRITGTTLRSRDLEYKTDLARDLQEFAWQRFEEGRIKPVIDSVYTIEQVGEAHRYMEANKNKGKIILTIQ